MDKPGSASEQERIALEQERTERFKEKEKSGRFKAVIGVVPIFATMGTVMVALFTSMQNQSQYRDSQSASRFQSSVELLGNKSLTSRMGGIYLLGQVAHDNSSRRDSAMRILGAYLRANFPVTEVERSQELGHGPAGEEVRAAFSVLKYRGSTTDLDFGRVAARNLGMESTDMTGLIFAQSDLSGSQFSGANFKNVPLFGATLRSVNFRGANLSGANFDKAELTDSDLSGANISGTNFVGSIGLTSAMLAGATVSSTTKLPTGITVPKSSSASSTTSTANTVGAASIATAAPTSVASDTASETDTSPAS